MRTKVTGRFVIGYERDDHVVYEHGEVVYEQDRVVFVGHAFPGQVDAVIDASESVVGPGFIDLDALADIDHALLDTWQPAELAAGLQWSEDYFLHRRRDVFSREDEALQRRYALVQLILNGVTTAMPIAAETHKCWAETPEQFADVAAIAGALGLRMYLGPSYRSGVNVMRPDGSPAVLWDERRGEEGLAGAVAFIEQFDGAYEGRLRGCLLPCRIETCTLDLLRATKRWSDELGCLVRLHAAQGAQELRLLRQRHDRAPIELLREIGFLGPRLAIPHAIHLRGSSLVDDERPDELQMLADAGTTVVHCPLTSIRHGHVLESFDRYRARGVNVALGTDTFPPDMLRVMDYGSNLAKLVARDQSAGALRDFYRAATLGGARALGRDDLGRLAPGTKADLITVDLGALRTGPIDDPIRTMVYNAGGCCVRDVIVDGRPIMRDGVIPGLDVAALRQDGQRYFERMKSAYAERDYLRRPSEALFPPSFPVASRGDA